MSDYQQPVGCIAKAETAPSDDSSHANPMISIGEAAAALGCKSAVTIHNMLARGELPGLKPGKAWVIPRRAFFERLNELAIDEAAIRRAQFAPPVPSTAFVYSPRRGPGRPRGR